MNKKVMFLSMFVMLITLLMIAVPALALPPETGTIEQGIVQVNTSPGTEWESGNIEHMRDGTADSYVFGSPWGNSLSGTGTVITWMLDTTTLTGKVVGNVEDTYASGVVKGMIFTTIDGAGVYTYLGPTFTFTLDGKSGTIVHGANYIGGLISGFAVKHGVSGDLKGLETKETFTGVNVRVGPLAGVIIIDNEVTYKLVG